MKNTPNSGWVDISLAPKDGSIIFVYDPKPSIEYGPDFHDVYWDKERLAFVAKEGVCTDPYDVYPESWWCDDISLLCNKE